MNILTLRTGDKYSSEDVNRLFEQLVSHSTCDFNFHCLTEDPKGLLDPIIEIPLWKPETADRQWNKLRLHDPQQTRIPMGERCMILDLDWEIKSDITDILTWPMKWGEFVSIYRWWSDLASICPLNGGLQMFFMGDTDHLWNKFYMNPIHYQETYAIQGKCEAGMGEQNFVHEELDIPRSYLPRHWFGKYNDKVIEHTRKKYVEEVDSYGMYFLDGEFDSKIKMVHYAGA